MSPPSDHTPTSEQVDQMVASVVDTSQIPKGKVEAAKEHILSLCQQLGKPLLTAEELLDSARPSDSPIHDMFEWDDEKAAEQHRLARARQILRSIKITIEHRGQPTTTRAFEFVNVDKDGTKIKGGYAPIAEILDNAHMTKNMLELAQRDLRSWYLKYRRLLRMTDRSISTREGLLRLVEEALSSEFESVEESAPKTGTDDAQ